MTYMCKLVEEDNGFFVEFPDLENVFAEGETAEQALDNAHQALNGVLEVDVSHGHLPPSPEAEGDELYPVQVLPHVEIAIQLRKIRGEKSQKTIADKLGLSYQAYQRLENPVKGNPTIKTLERVAKVLGRNLKVTFSV